MNQLEQVTRLITSTEYAAPIHVAILIKQLLNADGVIVVKPRPNGSGSPELIWFEGELSTASPGQTHRAEQSDGNTNVELLCDLAGDLYEESGLESVIQQTRFIAPADPESLHASSTGNYQAVYWQVSQRNGDLCYLWLRKSQPWLTSKEKHLFQKIRPFASRFLTGSPDDLTPPTPAGAISGNDESAWGTLSVMERKVLDLLREGRTEADVAQVLHRSPHTIHVHVKSLYRKFLVHSRAELLKAVQTRDLCPR